jgi:DNA uptake protein ComE-like DNA-binding protein
VWANKGEHSSLRGRGAASGDSWGRITNRDYALFVIQGLPGIGPKQAASILDTVGFPFGLKVTVDQLMTVPGIGKTRAEKIVRVFDAQEKLR